MIVTPLQKLPKNVGDLGKSIVSKGFKKLPKVQSITQSGHTALVPRNAHFFIISLLYLTPSFHDLKKLPDRRTELKRWRLCRHPDDMQRKSLTETQQQKS